MVGRTKLSPEEKVYTTWLRLIREVYSVGDYTPARAMPLEQSEKIVKRAKELRLAIKRRDSQ